MRHILVTAVGLIIADPGNSRIVSVKLAYSASASVQLGKVADQGK